MQTLLAAGALAHCGPALAEDEQKSLLNDSEILVTAQRREERLQDVPISIAVTSGARLESLHFNTASDLQFVTPGLDFTDSQSARASGFRIRGIGTAAVADAIEQSVGVVLDGVPLARIGQGLTDLADIEQIEVLRGPQGMLFGRNASIGLINITTRKPSAEPEFGANVSYGTGNELRLNGVASGPLGTTARARISGYLSERDGIVTNVTTGERYNDRKEYGVRGAFLLEPSDRVEIVVRGDWLRRDNRANIWAVNNFASSATDPRPNAFFLKNYIGPVASGPEARDINNDGDIFSIAENWGFSGEINWEIGEFTLTSLTAYRQWNFQDQIDADISPLNILNVSFGENDLHQISQEVRLSSPVDKNVSFVTGLFYFRTENVSFYRQEGRIVPIFAVNINVPIPIAPGIVLPPGQLFGRDIRTSVINEDFAAFGQATINLSDQFSLIAGGRITHAKVGLDFDRTGTPGSSAFNFLLGPAFAPINFQVDTQDTNFSWRIGGQYRPNRDLTFYATISRGYKGPGFNSNFDVVPLPGQTLEEQLLIRPEIPTNYEIGLKGSFLDRTLSVSLSLFHMEVKDFQAQAIEFSESLQVATFTLRNAGSLRSRGFEIDLRAMPIRDLTFGFGLAYTDGVFKDYQGAPCPRDGLAVRTIGAPCGPPAAGQPNATGFDASGLRLNGSPEWSGTLDGRWDFNLGGSGARGFLQALYSFRSSTLFGLYPDNIPNFTRQPDYGLLNTSLGVNFADNKVQVAVFARNLLDQNFLTNIGDLPFDGLGGRLQWVSPEAARTVGISAGLRF
ncbi:TonB-dependent receptor [Thermaurantiacus sp.]